MSRKRFVALGGVIRETFKVPQSHTEFTVDFGLTTAMNAGETARFGGSAQAAVQGRAAVRGQFGAGPGAFLSPRSRRRRDESRRRDRARLHRSRDGELRRDRDRRAAEATVARATARGDLERRRELV